MSSKLVGETERGGGCWRGGGEGQSPADCEIEAAEQEIREKVPESEDTCLWF